MTPEQQTAKCGRHTGPHEPTALNQVVKGTRRSTRRRVGVALLAGSMAIGASTSAVAAPAPRSPSQLMSAVLAATRLPTSIEASSFMEEPSA